jgi:2-keto-4-pentenoate hydratase/2-oxohepta-3-ene-1,7-dioic acid hydratase in catechol pathway
MRICRFSLDDLILTGFYADDHVIPIDQASEAYTQSEEGELELSATHDLLNLLPPDGDSFEAVRELSDWIDSLDPVSLNDLDLLIPRSEVRILVPIARPPKLLLLAGNYAAHVAERGGTSAEREQTFPYVFMKPPSTTLTHPGDPIVLPPDSAEHIDWECELGVVMGRRCRRVSEAEALEYVAGYTIVNDISDRKYRPNPGRKPRERDVFFDWLHGKWHDSFCPVGPCILSADALDDPQTLAIRLTVNRQVKQNACTDQMVFPVAAVIAFLSDLMTLEPGDIISTGTPAGVGSATGTYLKPGDEVAATIDGIGSLENPVLAEEPT